MIMHFSVNPKYKHYLGVQNLLRSLHKELKYHTFLYQETPSDDAREKARDAIQWCNYQIQINYIKKNDLELELGIKNHE